MAVMRVVYSRVSTEVTWPWEITGAPGSPEEEYGASIVQRMLEGKQFLIDSFGATVTDLIDTGDLVKHVDFTFPDVASRDAYQDHIDTDPDWIPAVPSTFGMSKEVVLDPS